MAVAVFPEKMDKLNVEDAEGSLRTIEDYILYITERVEFVLTNTYRTLGGGETTTLQVLLIISDIIKKQDEMAGTINQMQGLISGLGHDVSGLDARLQTVEGIVSGLDARLQTVEDILAAAGPILVEQPQDQTVAAGDQAAFAVRAVGTGLTYKWEQDDGGAWVEPAWSGHDGAEMTIPGSDVDATMDGRQIRCTVTGGGWTVISQPATLHVT